MSKKVKKATPELRFSGFTADWEYGKLRNLINKLDAGVSVNSASQKATFNEEGVLKTSCVSTGKFEPDESKLVSDKYEKTRLKEPVTKDTILICRSNTPIFVGANAYVEKNYPNLFLSDKLWAAKIKKNQIAKWVSYLLLKGTTRKLLSLRATGTSNSMKNISKGDLLTLPIYFPEKEEQEKIASFLDAIALRITKLHRKHELLETYKKGVMQKIFSQQIRFKQDDGKPFPDWEKKKIGDVFTRITGKNVENNTNVLTISAQYGLINQKDFFNKSVAAKDLTGYYLLKRGDFAYNKSYSNGYPMGAIKRLHLYEKGVVSSLYICFANSSEIESQFYEQYFDGGFLNRELSKIAQEGARNHGLLNMSVIEFFKDLNIDYPCIKEQEKVANFLTSIDKKIEAVALQIEKLEEFKKGLLQKMFV